MEDQSPIHHRSGVTFKSMHDCTMPYGVGIPLCRNDRHDYYCAPDLTSCTMLSSEDDESSQCSSFIAESSSSSREQKIFIEIFPGGGKMLLRGAKETLEAFHRTPSETVSCSCLGCWAVINCIHDAEYVLCPLCRVVSPMDILPMTTPMEESSCWPSPRIGGLGLGFTTANEKKI